MWDRTKRIDKSTDEVTEYSWDIRDRLTGITVKDVNGDIIKSAEYKYDVYNQRIAKTVDADGDGAAVATTERYVYGRDQNIGLVFDENGNLNHRYLFGNGVDQIEADESNGNVLWALADHLGNVRDVVDNAGTVLNHIVYDAFGGVTSQTDESVVFRYGYTARELDAESGLQYNRARYLDSFTGRFISEDPIGFQAGDSNLYRYVFNSPIRYTDPDGLQSRELYALFTSSQESLSKGTRVYFLQSPDLSSAYALASAWFAAIIIPERVLYPKNEPVGGTLVYQNLRDVYKDYAGKGVLRSYSTSEVNGFKVPTIELQRDDRGNRHDTPYFQHVTEVKFGFAKRDKDPKECVYFAPVLTDQVQRQIANTKVRNIILGTYFKPEEPPSWNLPQIRLPDNIPWLLPSRFPFPSEAYN